jgi:hypothetical protein
MLHFQCSAVYSTLNIENGALNIERYFGAKQNER